MSAAESRYADYESVVKKKLKIVLWNPLTSHCGGGNIPFVAGSKTGETRITKANSYQYLRATYAANSVAQNTTAGASGIVPAPPTPLTSLYRGIDSFLAVEGWCLFPFGVRRRRDSDIKTHDNVPTRRTA